MIPFSRLLAETRAILNLAIHNKNTSQEDKLRMKHYLILLLCGVPLIFAFGIYNILKGDQTLYIIIFTLLLILIFSWFRLLSTPNPKRIYRLSISAFAVLLCYNFTHGGMLDGRLLWLYTFPLIVFFILGTSEGLVWIIAVPLISVILHFSVFSIVESHSHNLEYLLRYLIVYSILSAIAYWFELFRSQYHNDLNLQHKRFYDILAHSKDILYRRDIISGKYQYISDAFGEHLGYSPLEYKTYTHNDVVALIHPDDRANYLEQTAMITKRTTHPKDQSSCQYRMRNQSGEYLWFRDQTALLYNDNNEPDAIIGSSREVTDLRLAHEALQEAQQQLLTILDAIDAHIYVADMNTYEILFTNNQMQLDFRTDLNGKICWQEFKKRDSPCENCSNSLLLDVNGKSTGVHTWEGYNGVTNRWYLNHDRAIQWLDDRWVRIQIATDITRQKYLEDEKKHNEELIRRAKQLETVSTLTGGIAHDFNNLLQVIFGNIVIIEHSKSGNEQKQASLAELKTAAKRASELVNKMLTISSERPKYRLPMPIVPFLEQILTEETEGRAIKKELIITPSLWLVIIDYNQIITALKNIFKNACDSISGKGLITVRAENYVHQKFIDPSEIGADRLTDGLKSGKYVKISIEDNGRGIDPEDIDKVFEPYFTTKVRGAIKGLGLGLTITNAIITQHSGVIRLESQKKEGTTVTLFLPATEQNIEYRVP